MIEIVFAILVHLTAQSSNSTQILMSNPEDSNKTLEICFYSLKRSKCPPNINKSNVFGPGEYNSIILSHSPLSVKINIVEYITLSKPLILSAPIHFYIKGYPINGKIEIHSRTSVYIQDPTKTDFTLYWSVKSKEIAKLNTNSQAKSIYIQISNQSSSISQYSLQFYTGMPTSINISNEFYKNNQYLINVTNNFYYVLVNSKEKAFKNILNTISASLSEKVKYTYDNYQLKIEGDGDMINFQDYLSIPWYSYRNKIESVIINDGITSISDYCFYECVQIINITISNDVTKIGKSSFSYCSKLVNIALPEKVESIGSFVFCYCKMLITLIIPPKVTHISDNAFLNCDNLLFIKTHDDIDSIGEHCFSGCIRMTSFLIPKKVKIIPDYAFYNCSSIIFLDFPKSVISIGKFAYFNCVSIRSVSITEQIETIGKCAFALCHTNLHHLYFEVDAKNPFYKYENYALLTKKDNRLIMCFYRDNEPYEMPSYITSIEDYAFYSLNNLLYVNIPLGVESIRSYAFYKCENILEFTAPNLKTIDKFALCNCTSLTNFTAPKLNNIGEYVLCNCTSLINFTAPKLSHLSEYAFLNCIKMPTFDLTNVVSIGDHAFDSCYEINNLYFPSCLKYIGKYVFLKCVYLTNYQIHPDNKLIFAHQGVIYNSTDLSVIYVSNRYFFSSFQFHQSVKLIPSYSFYACYYLDEIKIPEQISVIGEYAFAHCYDLKSIEFLGDLVSIDNYAFSFCKLLEKVIIHKSLKSIGHHAFYNCVNLKDLSLPDDVNYIGEYAFYQCINFESFRIPNNVHSIEKSTFGFCNNLKILNIEANIIDIKTCAFANITGLQSFTVSENNMNYKSINDVLFSKNGSLLISYPPQKNDNYYEIPDSVTCICDYAFINCNLLELNIPDNIIIGNYAFSKCGIQSIKIPGNLNFIGKYMFSDCTNLKSVEILNGCTYISEGQFFGCCHLTDIIIPNSVTFISSYAFYLCEKLTSIELTNNIRYIGKYSFAYTSELTSISFPNSLSFIEDYSFAFSGIYSIDFSDSIELIGIGSFLECSNLKSIIIPPNVKIIGREAFHQCSLRCVNLSIGLTTIFNYAFSYNNLGSIEIPKSVTIIGGNAFRLSNLLMVTIYSNLAYLGPEAFYYNKLDNLTYYGSVFPRYDGEVFTYWLRIYVTPNFLYDHFCGIGGIVTMNQSYIDITATDDYNYFCDVKNCWYCYSDDSLRCKKCRDGYIKTINENECARSTVSYTDKYEIYKEIDEDLIDNGTYLFEANSSSLRYNETLILNLDPKKYAIDHIIVNNPDSEDIAINISDNYDELFISSLYNETTKLWVYTTSKNIKFHVNSYMRLSFIKSKGKIEIINDKYDAITIGEVHLSTTDFIINEGKKIVEILGLNITNDMKLDFKYLNWKIHFLKIPPNVSLQLSNASLKTVSIDQKSELIVDKSVLLSNAYFRIELYENFSTNNKPFIRGSIDRKRPIGVYFDKQRVFDPFINISKILIAESDENFFCNGWAVNYDKNFEMYNLGTLCVQEIVNGSKVVRLYSNEVVKRSYLKNFKIGFEVISAIVVGSATVIAIIASIIIYFCVLKKKKLLSSSSH